MTTAQEKAEDKREAAAELKAEQLKEDKAQVKTDAKAAVVQGVADKAEADKKKVARIAWAKDYHK